MRHVVARILIGALGATSIVPASYAEPASVNARTASAVAVASAKSEVLRILFVQHRQGGDELTSRIADLIVADPTYASALADYFVSDKSLNDLQRQAARQGLADAFSRLNVYGQAGGGGLAGFGGLTGQQLLMALGALGLVGVIAGVIINNQRKSSPN